MVEPVPTPPRCQQVSMLSPLSYLIDAVNVSLEADLSSDETICTEDKPTVKCVRISISKVQVLSSYFGFVVPVIISIYYSWVKKQWQIIDIIKKQLSTVQLDNIYPKVLLNVIPVGDVLQITINNWLVKGLLDRLHEEKCQEKIVNCEVLHDPGSELRKADIIFVHGIKGALEKTWTQGGWGLTRLQVLNLREEKQTTWEVEIQEDKNSDPKSICWPRDWLPKDCPYARVIAINYTTDPYLWRPVWMPKHIRSGMSERSWEMIDSLVDLGVGKHSIFWVGHSKGGLYVKQVLVNACESSEDKYKDLSNKTRGVIFYSVPHRGSILANLRIPLLRKSIELCEVQKDCKEVLTLHHKFKELLNSQDLAITVKSFIETRLTLMGFVYVKIVSEESADAEVGELYGIPLDHRNICKPKNRECFLYKELVKLIQTNSEV
ncbi:protein SERAC1 isoform X3 [Halyomorpha halys]|uniref:protein SERAC1 isoform X3 n=1 Tax=Halyomorpha halys TaxID=286706 RepID=UPI0006D4FAD6